MKIKLLDGAYNRTEVMQLMTEFIHIKVRYHEHKMSVGADGEEVRFREAEIRQLQQALFEAQQLVKSRSGTFWLTALLEVE